MTSWFGCLLLLPSCTYDSTVNQYASKSVTHGDDVVDSYSVTSFHCILIGSIRQVLKISTAHVGMELNRPVFNDVRSAKQSIYHHVGGSEGRSLQSKNCEDLCTTGRATFSLETTSCIIGQLSCFHYLYWFCNCFQVDPIMIISAKEAISWLIALTFSSKMNCILSC
jgi:hypothetical protein